MEVYKKEEATRNPETPGVTDNFTEPGIGKCLQDLIAEVADLKKQLLGSRTKSYAKLTRVLTDLEENSHELEAQKASIEMIDDKVTEILAFKEAIMPGKIGFFPKADSYH